MKNRDVSMNRLKALKNKFNGQRIFIIGNGPSLNKIDMKRLEKEYTFSFNRAYIAYDKWGFIPQFYSVIDKVVLPDNRETLRQMADDPRYRNTLFFFPDWAENVLKKNTANIYYMKDHSRLRFFEENLRRFVVLVNVGASSVQIATYMGFREIILLGCDANYVEQPREVEIDQEETRRVGWTAYKSTGDSDPNHFCPEYFGKGTKYSIPNAVNHLRGWMEVKKWLQVYNGLNHEPISVLNASPGSKLECFEKVDFESVQNHPPGYWCQREKQGAKNDGANKEPIVIFGTERSARKFLETYPHKYSVSYFVDNDREKWNESLYAKPIKNPDVLATEKEIGKIVVCVTDGMNRLKKQLTGLGVFDRCLFFQEGKP